MTNKRAVVLLWVVSAVWATHTTQIDCPQCAEFYTIARDDSLYSFTDTTSGTSLELLFGTGNSKSADLSNLNGGAGFPFFDNFYTTVHINPFGLLSFTADDALSRWTAWAHTPNNNAPNNYVACLWDDLVSSDPLAIEDQGVTPAFRYSTTTLSDGRDGFVMEWDTYYYRIDTTADAGDFRVWFQTVLVDNGDVICNYRSLPVHSVYGGAVNIERVDEVHHGLSGMGVENENGGLGIPYNLTSLTSFPAALHVTPVRVEGITYYGVQCQPGKSCDISQDIVDASDCKGRTECSFEFTATFDTNLRPVLDKGGAILKQFQIVGGQAPKGLTLGSDGVLSGVLGMNTDQDSETVVLNVTASDSYGGVVFQTLFVTVNAPTFDNAVAALLLESGYELPWGLGSGCFDGGGACQRGECDFNGACTAETQTACGIRAGTSPAASPYCAPKRLTRAVPSIPVPFLVPISVKAVGPGYAGGGDPEWIGLQRMGSGTPCSNVVSVAEVQAPATCPLDDCTFVGSVTLEVPQAGNYSVCFSNDPSLSQADPNAAQWLLQETAFAYFHDLTSSASLTIDSLAARAELKPDTAVPFIITPTNTLTQSDITLYVEQQQDWVAGLVLKGQSCSPRPTSVSTVFHSSGNLVSVFTVPATGEYSACFSADKGANWQQQAPSASVAYPVPCVPPNCPSDVNTITMSVLCGPEGQAAVDITTASERFVVDQSGSSVVCAVRLAADPQVSVKFDVFVSPDEVLQGDRDDAGNLVWWHSTIAPNVLQFTGGSDGTWNDQAPFGITGVRDPAHPLTKDRDFSVILQGPSGYLGEIKFRMEQVLFPTISAIVNQEPFVAGDSTLRVLNLQDPAVCEAVATGLSDTAGAIQVPKTGKVWNGMCLVFTPPISPLYGNCTSPQCSNRPCHFRLLGTNLGVGGVPQVEFLGTSTASTKEVRHVQHTNLAFDDPIFDLPAFSGVIAIDGYRVSREQQQQFFAEMLTFPCPTALQSEPKRVAVTSADTAARTMCYGTGRYATDCTSLFTPFFTDDCLQPGTFGTGQDCVSCTGLDVVCPGGRRAWPKTGFWLATEGTDPTEVQACLEPSNRCAGRPFDDAKSEVVFQRLPPVDGDDELNTNRNLCDWGYEGHMCSQCETGYYKESPSFEGSACKSCAEGGEVTSRLVGAVVFFALLGVGIILLTDSICDMFVIGFVTAQQIITVGLSSDIEMPIWYQKVYTALQIFMFDFQWIRSGCDFGEVKGTTVYFVTLGVCAVVFSFFALCGLLYQWRKSELGERWTNNPSHPRVKRAMIYAFHVTYLIITLRSMQIVHCTYIYDEELQDYAYKLVEEKGVTCFEGDHLVAFIAALMILVFYCVALPISLWRMLQLAKHQGKFSQKEFLHKWSFLYRNLKPFWYWFRFISQYFVSFAICIQGILSAAQHDLLEVTYAAVVFGLVLLLTVFSTPYLRVRNNVSAVGIASVKTLSVAWTVAISGEEKNVKYTISTAAFTVGIVIVALLWKWRLAKKHGLTLKEEIERIPPSDMQHLPAWSHVHQRKKEVWEGNDADKGEIWNTGDAGADQEQGGEGGMEMTSVHDNEADAVERELDRQRDAFTAGDQHSDSRSFSSSASRSSSVQP